LTYSSVMTAAVTAAAAAAAVTAAAAAAAAGLDAEGVEAGAEEAITGAEAAVGVSVATGAGAGADVDAPSATFVPFDATSPSSSSCVSPHCVSPSTPSAGTGAVSRSRRGSTASMGANLDMRRQSADFSNIFLSREPQAAQVLEKAVLPSSPEEEPVAVADGERVGEQEQE